MGCVCFGAGRALNVGQMEVRLGRQIAEGGFAYVFLATDCHDSELTYAVKKMLIQTKEQRAAAEREIEVLEAVRHPNICLLLAHSIVPRPGSEESDCIMVFPFYSDGSVFDLMSKHLDKPKWIFPEQEALRIFLGLCAAIKCLHQRGYRHQDIKPHNLMLSRAEKGGKGGKTKSTSKPKDKEGDLGDMEQGMMAGNREEGVKMSGDKEKESDEGGQIITAHLQPVLIDLGSCAPLVIQVDSRGQALQLQEEAAVVSTSSYRPPELYDVKSQCVVDGRSDVWMAGCTLYAMAFGRCPFEDPVQGVLTLAICSGSLNFPPGNKFKDCQFSSQFCSLIRRLLSANPVIRPTIDEAIEWATLVMRKETLPPHASAVADDVPNPPTSSGSSAVNIPTGDDEWTPFMSK